MAKKTAMVVATGTSVDDWDPQAAINSFTPVEKTLYKAISEHVNKHINTELQSRWDAGMLLANAYAHQRAHGDKYGKDLTIRLASALHCSVESLDTLRRVVETFKTLAQYNKYTVQVGPGGNRLLWAHMIELSHIRDDNQRWEVANLALKSEHSPAAIKSSIREANGSAIATRNGAPVRLHKSAMACLASIRQITGRYVKLVDESWMSEEFDLTTRVKNELPEHLPAMRQEVDRSVELVQQLADKIESLAAMLRGATCIIEQRMDDGGLNVIDTVSENIDEDDEINMLEYKKQLAAENAPKKRKRKQA